MRVNQEWPAVASTANSRLWCQQKAIRHLKQELCRQWWERKITLFACE